MRIMIKIQKEARTGVMLFDCFS
jgi:hypothetical protein